MTRNKPCLVGLTGGIACGKSNISNALRSTGAGVIDADSISRSLTAPGGAALSAIRARFGEGVFDGSILNRKKLSDAVFGKPGELAALNSIMHPLVFLEMERQMREMERAPALVLDVPLLYETGYDRFCDEVWCVWAPQDDQVRRLMQRGLTKEEAMNRILSQMPAIEKARRADHVLITTGSKEDTARMATRLWDGLLRRLHVG